MSFNIISTGKYLPGRPIQNTDLEQFPEEIQKLIYVKSGVQQRYQIAEGESTSDIAAAAIDNCLSKANISPDEIDGLILSTSTPDHLLPQTAAIAQGKSNLKNAFAFDINAVCAGGLFAYHVAESLLLTNQYKNILVVAAEAYSRFLSKNDVASYPYFGDGAAALLISTDNIARKFGKTVLHNDGKNYGVILIPAGGSVNPGWECSKTTDFYFRMQGREVFTFATEKGAEIIFECLQQSEMSPDDIDHVILHQANINIIDAIAQKTQIPREKFFANIEHTANVASASALLAFNEAIEKEIIQRGDVVLMAAFGGGLSWAATIVQY